MDTLLKETVELLEHIDHKINKLKEASSMNDNYVSWSDIDDNFRNVQRNIKLYILKIDEAIRWD